eukprot:TRINITY_DN4603_c0_g1_i1.p1 TRINITY_DN4603_c0_g1~~TRINITY_DN4603_c0_g1_i1.p1  ORF type:complete len:494 (-),score=20.47 TRINITY_DN4603_c0_g1_i1:108-1568(-)
MSKFHKYRSEAAFRFWLAWNPWWLTPQDKALLEALWLSKQSRKACLVSAHRGCRKSMTALRICLRKVFLQVDYVNAYSFDGTENAKGLRLSHLQRSLASEVAGAVCIFFLVCLVWAFFIWLWMDPRQEVLHEEEKNEEQTKLSAYLEKVKSEMPSHVSIGVTIIAGLAGFYQAYRRRYRPIIIDDPIQCYMRLGANSRPAKAMGFLDLLRDLGEKRPVVIISSNEGIDRCFSDPAPGLHVVVHFPPPTTDEIARIAHEIVTSKRKSALSVVEADHVHKAQEFVPFHHANSLRFWMLLEQAGVLDIFCDSLKRGSVKISTKSLMMLSLSLDLAAEETFAATAFASSPQMDESEKQKLRDLVGVQSLNLPDNLPRRLGLTYALVRSQQKNFEDFKVAAAKKQVLKKHLLPQFKEPVYPPELDEYRVFCKAVEKRISTTPKENPRVLDDYEEFVLPLLTEVQGVLAPPRFVPRKALESLSPHKIKHTAS